jgi:hypothetical protein
MENLIPKIVSVSALRGISDIKTSSGKVAPKLYSQATKNRQAEGNYEGDFDNQPFFGTKQFISPEWDNLRKEWYWQGDQTTFTRLVKAMDLRYPKNHYNAGAPIEVEDLNTHLNRRNDPVFQNPKVLSKFFLKGGRGVLRVENDPLHEFLYRCMREDRRFIDETSEDASGRENPNAIAGARYKLTAAKRKNLRKRTSVDKRLKAATALGKMVNNEPRLRAICTLTKVPGYSSRTDLNGMVVFLDEQITNHSTRSIQRQGNASFIDVFLLYADMPNDRLKFEYDVQMAIDRGIIRMFPGGFSLQGETINGPDNFKQLVQYFTDEAHQDNYIKLVNYLNT